MDRVELAKALRLANLMHSFSSPLEWGEALEEVRTDWLRTADKALELLAPKGASDDELGKRNGDLCDQIFHLEGERNALRSRVNELERQAGCYAEEIAGLRKAASERSDLASEVTELRAQLLTTAASADRWRRMFRRQLAIASDLAEGAT